MSAMSDVLILIDIQNDYFPGGRMELVGAEAAGRAAADVQTAYLAGLSAVFAQEMKRGIAVAVSNQGAASPESLGG